MQEKAKPSAARLNPFAVAAETMLPPNFESSRPVPMGNPDEPFILTGLLTDPSRSTTIVCPVLRPQIFLSTLSSPLLYIHFSIQKHARPPEPSALSLPCHLSSTSKCRFDLSVEHYWANWHQLKYEAHGFRLPYSLSYKPRPEYTVSKSAQIGVARMYADTLIVDQDTRCFHPLSHNPY